MSEKRSIQIVTLGCSKNEVDSEHLLAQIRDEYEIVPCFNSPAAYASE